MSTSSALWFGLISWSFSFGILVPAYFFMAICVHDAIHCAAHDSPRLNSFVGWTGAAMLAIPFPTIRRAHLHHHASLGHDHDDERFIYRSALTLPVRLLVVNWRCYGVLLRSPREEQVQAILLLAAYALMLGWRPLPLFWGWVLPMQIGAALFAFMSVYLPHGPFAKWIMEHAPALTGFHEDHHASPHLPWYEHFTRRRSPLESQLAPGLRSTTESNCEEDNDSPSQVAASNTTTMLSSASHSRSL